MKATIISIFFYFLTFSLFSQTFTKLNEPQIGASAIMYCIEDSK